LQEGYIRVVQRISLYKAGICFCGLEEIRIEAKRKGEVEREWRRLLGET
jgi:hypothetical protein